MTSFDYAIILVLLISVSLGLWRGLTYELLSLAGWLVAFLVSRFAAPPLAPMLPFEQPAVQAAVAYVVLFLLSLVLWSILVRLASKLVKAAGLGALDLVMGGLFGFLRGALIVLVLAWLSGLTRIPEQDFWTKAQLHQVVEDVALATRNWLPETVATRIQYRARPARRA